jgi:hypothetical protein
MKAEDRGRRRYRKDSQHPWRVNKNRNVEVRFTCIRCDGDDWWPQITKHGREHPELCTECWRDDFYRRPQSTTTAAKVRYDVVARTTK